MIAFIQGTIFDIQDDSVIVLTAGIGYAVLVPERLRETLHTQQEVSLYTYHAIREDASELFGFTEKDEYQLFTQLIKVSGVGPRMALNVISGYMPSAIRSAIVQQDIQMLTSISGIGKKTAERIVVELKDSPDFLQGVVNAGGSGVAAASGAETGQYMTDEAPSTAQALLALGYSSAEVAQVLARIDTTRSTEDQVREALQFLS